MLSETTHKGIHKCNGPSHSEAVAHELAQLSQLLLPLMRDNGLSVNFSDILPGGLCIADASRNPTNAYKVRGALASANEAKIKGHDLLVTASAGNHGAGLAYAAQLLGMRARIYVPENAPEVKISTIKGFGATVIKIGKTFDETLAFARLDEDVKAKRGVFIHPFDDKTVVAGQGTIGLEILAHAKTLVPGSDCNVVRVFLPIGGGGLVAGVASALRKNWPETYPKLEIVGVIDESAPASLLATLFGRPVKVVPETVADGTKVAMVGQIFLSVSRLVDHIMLVPHDQIVDAMRSHESRTVLLSASSDFSKLEGAGALALAGEEVAGNYKLFGREERPLSIAVVSGRNVDTSRYHEVVTEKARLDPRSYSRQGFDVVVQERPRELLRFLRAVKDYNIASLTYKQERRKSTGHLRVEFEVANGSVEELERMLAVEFHGSRRLSPGEHMLYKIGDPVAQRYREELIILNDKPGSFLDYVQGLSTQGRLGSVGFLFYRKPAQAGAAAQVVIGHSQTPLPVIQ